MKILTLRFGNLNSLQGEWQIDFTRPEYVSDGLFAITGPTGSGKSTILDALCLALYGETPRLGKITAGSNEIMSRHAGECFAEVTFAATSGTFRCTWSQHRSRKKSGGALQAQKHEIADAVSGLIIQSKVQETRQEVEVRTGMDFDRFTRSMLLAQGRFARFLQANPDERAPVLEQITGTEIYSLISVKVHERKREERERLNRLEGDAGGIRLLGAETLAELEAERAVLAKRDREVSAALEADSAAQSWFEELARLEALLVESGREFESLELDRQAFLGDAQRLELARTAALVEHGYGQVQLIRQEVQRSASELAAKETQGPEAVRSVEETHKAHDAAHRELEQASNAIKEAKPLLARARQLDEQIAGTSAELERLKRERNEHEQRFQQLQRERLEALRTLESTNVALRELRDWQEQRHLDASLTEALSGIQHALEELQPAAEREANAASAIEGLRRDQQKRKGELALAEVQARQMQGVLDASRHALDALKSSFTSKLDGATLKELRAEFDAFRDHQRQLEQLKELYIKGKKFAPKIEELDNELKSAKQRLDELSQKLAHAREHLSHAEREAASQEEIARLADKVRSLEEQRARLVEGEACPLCGSLHHPYVEGSREAPNLDGEALQAARAAVRERSSAVRDFEIALAQTVKEIEEAQKRHEELSELYRSSVQECLELLKLAAIDAPASQAEPVVLAALRLAATQRKELGERIEELETLEQRIHDQQAALWQHQESAQNANRRLEQANEQQRSLQLDLARSEQELDEARRTLAGRRQSFSKLLEPFGVQEFDEPSVLVAALEERAESWERSAGRIRTLEQEELAGQSCLAALDRPLATAEADRLAKRRAVEASIATLEALTVERADLFDGNGANAEEARLERALQAAGEKLDAAAEAHHAAREARSVLDSAIDGLRTMLQERRAELEERQASFSKELEERGFSDEAAFLAARLELAERQQLEQRASSIGKRTHELEARRNERQAQLDQARKRRPLTEESSELLLERIAQRKKELREVSGRIGAIASQLAEHEQATEQHRTALQAIEAQSLEYRRWEMLHELVGSADGKKFRNFAQGITFELMIQNANRQLRQMTDRYELLHDPNQPLELSVIDQWQAGQIRSTRNLSGGESFIVSLALALGLSQMSSRNVRVDSLFLDEGFGTLDDEALETALETLAGLQQSGKLIGVISHVAALRERISTHIRVKPQTGGRSIIEGPGVNAGSVGRAHELIR